MGSRAKMGHFWRHPLKIKGAIPPMLKAVRNTQKAASVCLNPAADSSPGSVPFGLMHWHRKETLNHAYAKHMLNSNKPIWGNLNEAHANWKKQIRHVEDSGKANVRCSCSASIHISKWRQPGRTTPAGIAFPD
jgi:hypothetical protein